MNMMTLSWGWCTVTSMGTYDHTKGGHLILWELGLAVEFPPYSTIFLPSAVLTHGNTAVGVTEWWSTITQYSTQGLFRWVAYGYSLKHEKKMSGKGWWDSPKHVLLGAWKIRYKYPVTWQMYQLSECGPPLLREHHAWLVAIFKDLQLWWYV